MNILKFIGRTQELFTDDISGHQAVLNKAVSQARFLVLGGSGSIGQAVT